MPALHFIFVHSSRYESEMLFKICHGIYIFTLIDTYVCMCVRKLFGNMYFITKVSPPPQTQKKKYIYEKKIVPLPDTRYQFLFSPRPDICIYAFILVLVSIGVFFNVPAT